MTSRAWKRNPWRSRVASALCSPPESARVLSPYFDFSTFVSGAFFEKKAPKPFSSNTFTDIQLYGFTDRLLPECFAPTGRGPMKTQGFEARFSQNLAPVSREKP